MLAVVLVSLNLLAVRYLFPSHLDVIVTTLPTAIALQVASLACLNRRTKIRTFSAGFVAGGSVAVLLFFCGTFFHESRLTGIIGRYWVVSSEALRYLLPLTKTLFHDRIYFVIQGIPIRLGGLMQDAILLCIPQVLSALVSGWLALILIRQPHREDPLSQPQS